MSNYKNISALLGKTLSDINVDRDNDEIIFTCTDGDQFKMLHMQDCCESVSIDDIVGDIQDLLDSPITMAEVVTNDDAKPKEYADESYTWTFYKLATVKGYVNIKWFGTSNGYYSEGVDFIEL